MQPPVTRRSILGTAIVAAGVPLASDASAGNVVGRTDDIVTVPLFTQIATYPVPSGASTIVTTGHTVPGSGGARYTLDGTSPDRVAIVRRSPHTSALTRDGRLFVLDPAGPLSVLALGAKGDGVADDGPAIQDYLNSLGTVAGGGADVPVTIDFHDRHYRLNKPLVIAQNLICLHAGGATLDGGGQSPGLIRVDHDGSINSPTGVAITGRWFVRGVTGDAILLRSAPLFTVGRVHAIAVAGDVVNVQGCVGGVVELIEAYDCGGLAYRELAMTKRYAGDNGGRRINCINNRVDTIRAFRCGGAWMASESWHASVGRIDVESSKGAGVVVESCLAPSFGSIYEEDHAVAIVVRTMPRVFGSDFPVGDALLDTVYTAGALLPDGSRPCSIQIAQAAGTVVRAGRICGDIRLGAGATDTRIERGVDLIGRLDDAGVRTRIDRHGRRIVTVRAGARGADIGFERLEVDDRYLPVVRAIGWTGAPTPGALMAKGVDPTRGGFRLELLAPVDPGCTVTFLAEAC